VCEEKVGRLQMEKKISIVSWGGDRVSWWGWRKGGRGKDVKRCKRVESWTQKRKGAHKKSRGSLGDQKGPYGDIGYKNERQKNTGYWVCKRDRWIRAKKKKRSRLWGGKKKEKTTEKEGPSFCPDELADVGKGLVGFTQFQGGKNMAGAS